MDALNNLGINLGYLLLQIFGFIILFLVVKGYAYAPILKVLEDRKARIAKGLEDARQAALARDNADEEVKTVLDNARAEAAKIRTEATVQSEETAVAITVTANEEAKEIISTARQDAEDERNRILADLRSQVASISIAAANKLVGESLDDKRQHEIIADFFAAVPAGVTGLEGDAAEVTSALPLTDQEQNSIKKTIGVEDVRFKVNPEILGGLVVRVGDQVVDDSVAGQMSELREALVQ